MIAPAGDGIAVYRLSRCRLDSDMRRAEGMGESRGHERRCGLHAPDRFSQDEGPFAPLITL